MSPPAPRNTYIDQYPDDAAQQDSGIEDNIRQRDNYEAEVIIYRVLERIDNRVIVLHGFKCTNYQYNLCDPTYDMVGRNSKDSTECDFLIVGGNFFVVIEVKNTSIGDGGNPLKAFQESIKQRTRIERMIKSVHPESIVLLFTAFPSIYSSSFDQFNDEQTPEFTVSKKERESVIFQNNLADFSQWWLAYVQQKIPPIPSLNISGHEKVKHILLTISCTDEDVPDESTFSLAKTVMRINKELRDGEITLEQNFKKPKGKRSINTGVVKAPNVIREFVGVKYLTKEQDEVFQSEQKLLWLIGPAGSGKTILLAGKLIQLLQLDPNKKGVVFKYAGLNNNSTTYQTACRKAGVEFLLLDLLGNQGLANNNDYKSSLPSPLYSSSKLLDEIKRCDKTVVIVNMNRVHLEWPKEVFPQLSNSVIIVDDIQSWHDFHYRDQSRLLVEELTKSSESNRIMVACDVVQHYGFSYVKWNAFLSTDDNDIPDDILYAVPNVMCKQLTRNLRNACGLAKILSVVRKNYIESELHIGYMAPIQHLGHFIHGPMTKFHIFDKFHFGIIRNILNKELVKLCMDKDLDYSDFALVFNRFDLGNDINSEMLERPQDPRKHLFEDTSGIDADKITLCRCVDSFSSEWPTVIVLHAVDADDPDNLTELYLAISRARVKCTVLLFPEKGKTLKKNKVFAGLLDEIESLVHLLKH